jgi:hypothetical protein
MYSFLITALICISLTVAAIRYKSRVSLSFAFLCFCCAMWSVELYLLSSLKSLETLLPLFHTFRIGLFFIGPAMLLLSDGTPIFLYYYQSARMNWIHLVFIVPAPVNQYRLLYQPLEFCLHLLK